MLALFFEVRPVDGGVATYLERAAALRPALDRSGGCLFLDRLRSLDRDGWLLSFQLWEDAAALDRWRRDAGHREAQQAGRGGLLADYRLRVAEVHARAPAAAGPDCLRLAEAMDATPEGPGEVFESLYRPGVRVRLAQLPWDQATTAGAGTSARCCHVLRDYGPVDRAQAPDDALAAPAS